MKHETDPTTYLHGLIGFCRQHDVHLNQGRLVVLQLLARQSTPIDAIQLYKKAFELNPHIRLGVVYALLRQLSAAHLIQASDCQVEHRRKLWSISTVQFGRSRSAQGNETALSPRELVEHPEIQDTLEILRPEVTL